MLLYLFLFLSFVQIGLFSVGGDASAQALLEHEVLTLHHWLSPEACTDLMTLLRPLVPGLVVAAALLMAKEAGLLADATDAWHKGVSAFLFVATVVGVRVYRFNPLFMLLLYGVAGCLLL